MARLRDSTTAVRQSNTVPPFAHAHELRPSSDSRISVSIGGVERQVDPPPPCHEPARQTSRWVRFGTESNPQTASLACRRASRSQGWGDLPLAQGQHSSCSNNIIYRPTSSQHAHYLLETPAMERCGKVRALALTRRGPDSCSIARSPYRLRPRRTPQRTHCTFRCRNQRRKTCT